MITREEVQKRLAAKRANVEARVPFVEGELSMAEELLDSVSSGVDKLLTQKERLESKLDKLEDFENSLISLPTAFVQILVEGPELQQLLRFCELKNKPHEGILEG